MKIYGLIFGVLICSIAVGFIVASFFVWELRLSRLMGLSVVALLAGVLLIKYSVEKRIGNL